MAWHSERRSRGKAHALQYAAHGFRVVRMHPVRDGRCACAQGKACYRPGKHPSTPHGVKDATADPGQIKGWWAQAQTASGSLPAASQATAAHRLQAPEEGARAAANFFVDAGRVRPGRCARAEAECSSANDNHRRLPLGRRPMMRRLRRGQHRSGGANQFRLLRKNVSACRLVRCIRQPRVQASISATQDSAKLFVQPPPGLLGQGRSRGADVTVAQVRRSLRGPRGPAGHSLAATTSQRVFHLQVAAHAGAPKKPPSLCSAASLSAASCVFPAYHSSSLLSTASTVLTNLSRTSSEAAI